MKYIELQKIVDNKVFNVEVYLTEDLCLFSFLLLKDSVFVTYLNKEGSTDWKVNRIEFKVDSKKEVNTCLIDTKEKAEILKNLKEHLEGLETFVQGQEHYWKLWKNSYKEMKFSDYVRHVYEFIGESGMFMLSAYTSHKNTKIENEIIDVISRRHGIENDTKKQFKTFLESQINLIFKLTDSNISPTIHKVELNNSFKITYKN